MTGALHLVPSQSTSSLPPSPFLFIDIVLDPLGRHTLGPLQRQAQCTVPEALRQGPERTRDAKENSVVVELLEAVVPEQDA